MSKNDNKIMLEIRHLIRNRKLKDAKDKLEKIEKKKDLSTEDKIRMKLLYSLYFNYEFFTDSKQEYKQKALEIATQGLEESKKTNEKFLIIDAYLNIADLFLERHLYKDSLENLLEAEKLISAIKTETSDLIERKAQLNYLKGANLVWSGEFENSKKILLEGIKLCKKINDKYIQNRIHIHLAGIGISQGNFNYSIENLDEGLKLALEIDNKPCIAHFNDTLAAVYQWYGKYDTALEYIQKANSLYDEIGMRQLVAKTRLGFHYFYIGELDKAIEILDEIIPELLESDSKRWRCYGNWQKGLINWLKGNLDVAIESVLKAVRIAEEMNDRYHIDLFIVYLAAVYLDKGNYDQTMKLCLQSIKSSHLHQEKYTIAFANHLLGKVYHIQGDFNLAWDYAHKGLQQRKEMDAIHHTVESLFSLIQILIDKNDLTQAKNYFEELKNYVEKKPTKRFLLMEKISQAIIQKASTRPRLWIKAIDILEEVVNDEIIDHSLTVIALINLCELLINEFSFSGDSEVLIELENYTELLESIAKKQKSYYLRLEAGNIRILTMWLKAQYSIVDIDLQKAKDLLHEAQTMADEEGLTRLAEKITTQQGKFLERIDRWDDFIKKYYEFIKG